MCVYKECVLLSQALLDTVVQRTEGYSVERLERLFSLLSQCIYQHRLDYDKTRLQEVRRTRVARHTDKSLFGPPNAVDVCLVPEN